jgi:hypothetical protein
MSRDIRDLLHGASPEPSGRPDVDAIRRRGRTLVATRIAAVVSVVALAVAGATGLVLQMLSDDTVPPVIDEPTPSPTVDQEIVACAPVQSWPTYLPWVGDVKRPLPPDAVVDGVPGDPNSLAYWASDPNFEPGEVSDGPVVTLVNMLEPDVEPGEAGGREVEVAGHQGELIWVGDPGVGGIRITWREAPGPCGTYGLWLLTAGIGACLGESAMEEELVRVARSLVAWDPAAVGVEGCAAGGPFPEITDDEVWVFFYCDDPEAELASLYATVRVVPADREPIAVAMEALAAGPTGGEQTDGFRSTLAEMGEVRVLAASVDGTTAVVDLTGLPDELTQGQRSFLPPGFMEEIAWTVFHNDEQINAIELRLDGSCDAFWELLTGEGCSLYTRNQWGHIPEDG